MPVLAALYRSPEENRKRGHRHKTACDLMRQLLYVLLRWFPQRKFVFSGDGGFGTPPLARFAARQARLALVSKFYQAANFHHPRPQRKAGTQDRPRIQGHKQASPEAIVAQTRGRQRLNVSWYGGGRRQVALVTGTGHWDKSGAGLVPVRWVFVEDLTGTHRDEYLFTTDTQLTPREIIEADTGRWAIEVMFEEVREHVGLETTRGRCAQTILRAEPCLFGLSPLMALGFSELPEHDCREPAVTWTGSIKQTLTYSHAITLVRRHLWRNGVMESPHHATAFQKLTPTEKQATLTPLTQAM